MSKQPVSGPEGPSRWGRTTYALAVALVAILGAVVAYLTLLVLALSALLVSP